MGKKSKAEKDMILAAMMKQNADALAAGAKQNQQRNDKLQQEDSKQQQQQAQMMQQASQVAAAPVTPPQDPRAEEAVAAQQSDLMRQIASAGKSDSGDSSFSFSPPSTPSGGSSADAIVAQVTQGLQAQVVGRDTLQQVAAARDAGGGGTSGGASDSGPGASAMSARVASLGGGASPREPSSLVGEAFTAKRGLFGEATIRTSSAPGGSSAKADDLLADLNAIEDSQSEARPHRAGAKRPAARGLAGHARPRAIAAPPSLDRVLKAQPQILGSTPTAPIR